LKIVFRKSFEHDLRKLRNNTDLLARVKQVVNQVIAAEHFDAVSGAKKMQGWSGYYRFRVGDYRVGVKLQEAADLEENEVVFLRCLHRRDIYRKFP
jgi:mRNA interferase RelE/StbE